MSEGWGLWGVNFIISQFSHIMKQNRKRSKTERQFSVYNSLVSKKDGFLEFTNTFLETDSFTKFKLSIPWAKEAESLKITIDGNNLCVEGLYMHLNKLSRTLKNYTFNV